MTTTAMVETLTAEVRVLMVGSRQVTLSVAKQLDVVDLAELTTFGRVKLGREYDYVIGADAYGRLALARYERHGLHSGPWINREDLADGKLTVCKARLGRDYLTLTYLGGRKIQVHREIVQDCGVPEHNSYRREQCDHWNTNGLESLIDEAIAKHDTLVARHKSAAKAPLIVLAGLR